MSISVSIWLTELSTPVGEKPAWWFVNTGGIKSNYDETPADKADTGLPTVHNLVSNLHTLEQLKSLNHIKDISD